MPLNIVSWNVNGLRAAARRGFAEWLRQESPGIFCAQEVKAQRDQLPPEVVEPAGYHAYWNLGDRKGYSGVALFTKEEPRRVLGSFGIKKLDAEGRVLLAEYPHFTLLNVYFPNGKSGQQRLDYKLAFYDDFLEFVDGLRGRGQKIVICGDVNTAHHEIDIARPKQNEKLSGFLPIERAWMDRLEEHGYVDTFRQFNQAPGQYTYWDMKTRARDRNIGWRIDYFYVSQDMMPWVKDSSIRAEVMGSDHCPIGIALDVPAQ